MAAHQAPPSLGFSRQEHWSGLPFPSPMHESEKWKWSRSVVSDSYRPHGLQPTRLLCPWDFPGKSTGVGCHCLLLMEYYSTIKKEQDWVTCRDMDWSRKMPMSFELSFIGGKIRTRAQKTVFQIVEKLHPRAGGKITILEILLRGIHKGDDKS